jgi:hypothetical protein
MTKPRTFASTAAERPPPYAAARLFVERSRAVYVVRSSLKRHLPRMRRSLVSTEHGPTDMTDTERDDILDAAVLAAENAISHATSDPVARSELWQLFVVGTFLAVFSEAAVADQDSIARRLNDGLEAADAGWQLVRT